MKLTHKPVNVYTHPVLREYEFHRMRRIWHVGKIASISLLLVPSIIIGSFCIAALFEPRQVFIHVEPAPKVVQRVTISDDLTLDTDDRALTYSVEGTRIR